MAILYSRAKQRPGGHLIETGLILRKVQRSVRYRIKRAFGRQGSNIQKP
jgi:hypothetical protein